MKTLIQVAVVALIFGGLSAAATVFLQQRNSVPMASGADAAAAKTSAAADGCGTAANAKPEDTGSDHSAGAEAQPAENNAKPAVPSADEDNLLGAAEPSKHLTGTSESSHRVNDSDHGVSNHGRDSLRGEAPVAVRPPYTPEGDEAGAMINLLRDRARNATEKERQISQRQDAIKLIFDDLRAEQAQTLKLRQQLLRELKQSREAVDTAIQDIDSERNALRKEQEESRKSTETALRSAAEEQERLRKQLARAASPAPAEDVVPDPEKSQDDNSNLKKIAVVFDSMPVEDVAKVFQQLVKKKRSDAVVWLMNSMKERQTAKVLAALAETNAELAADLTERLKRLKLTSPTPTVDPDRPAAE